MQNIEAVIKPSGKLLINNEQHNYLDDLAQEIAFYTKKTGIPLPVVLGGGKGYNEICKKYHTPMINGLRLTPNELINEFVEKAKENQQEVYAALKKYGVDAEIMDMGILKAMPYGVVTNNDTNQEVDMCSTGFVATISIKPIIKALENGKIPLISNMGVDEDGKMYNVNAAPVAGELAFLLKAKKLILLGDTAVYDANKKVIPLITSQDYIEKQIQDKVFTEGICVNIDTITAVQQRFHEHNMRVNYQGHITTLKYDNQKHIVDGLYNEIIGNSHGTILRM